MARIVVADDDPDIRDLVVFKLRQSGHDVHPVADGAAAMEQCQFVTPDLVVLDVMMPGMGGLDAGRALRQDPALPGAGDPADRAGAGVRHRAGLRRGRRRLRGQALQPS